MKRVEVLILLIMVMAFSGCQKESAEKEMLSFQFVDPQVTAVIGLDGRVEVEVPFGTDITNLVPLIAVSDKATISPASGQPVDFTNPVVYTITAEDGSKASYVVTVSVAQMSVNDFLGVWGLELLEYYRVDYTGNIVLESSSLYDPFDVDHGIQLVFCENHLGEKRDRTDLLTVMGYTYNVDAAHLILNVNFDNGQGFDLEIKEYSNASFTYENYYDQRHMERAVLKRLPVDAIIPPTQYGVAHHKSFLGKDQ